MCSAPHSLRTESLVTLPFFLIIPQCRICVSSCPSGHYHADKKRCRKCAPNCESCFGSHGDQCLSCKYGYFLNEETNSCVTHCPDGSISFPLALFLLLFSLYSVSIQHFLFKYLCWHTSIFLYPLILKNKAKPSNNSATTAVTVRSFPLYKYITIHFIFPISVNIWAISRFWVFWF